MHFGMVGIMQISTCWTSQGYTTTTGKLCDLYNYTGAHLPHTGLCALSNGVCVPNIASTALKLTSGQS